MTILQATSSRNSNSASLVLSGAQSTHTRAVDAPGFAGVLDAFSNTESTTESQLTEDSTTEIQSEVNEELTESDDSSEQDSASKSDSESQADSNAAKDAHDSASTNLDDPNSPSSVANELPAEELDTQINSAKDLVKLLNNAAAIDIAGLAAQQLAGKAVQSVSEAAPKPTPATSTQPSSSQPSATPQAHNESVPKQTEPGFQSILPQHSKSAQSGQTPTEPGSQSPSNAAEAQSLSAQSVQPTNTAQSPKHSIDQQQLIQSSSAAVTRSVQASQAVAPQPAQAIDPSSARRKAQTLRTVDEIGVVAKSKSLKGTESTNSHSSGFDLGAQSDRSGQHATRLDAQDPQARTQEQALQRQQVLAQVQRGLASIINTKGGTMKLRMSPEHLGQVKIQLTTKDGHVKIKIDAETEHARSMLKDGLKDLQTTMESRGVHVDELSIEQREPNEFRLPTTAGQSNNQSAQSDPDSSRDTGSQHSDQHAGNQSTEPSQDPTDNETPQPIWTQLGLDAIA